MTSDEPALTLWQLWQTHCWSQWWFHNILTTLILLCVAGFIYYLSKRENIRMAWLQLRRRPAAMIALAFLLPYALVGIFDSYGWHQPILDAENKPVVDKKGKTVKDPRGLSVLDRFFCVWDDSRRMYVVRKEETYSAPLAEQTFVKESKIGDDGQVTREYAPLKHKGKYLLGTDQVGRDVLWLSLKGVRTGLIIGLLTTFLALPFAIFFGLSAGYFRGWVDDIVQFVYTVLGSIPSLLLIIAFMVLYDRGLPQLVFIMGITGWVGLCRLLRGETLKLRELEYVQAARALGAGPFSIIRKHLLPNVMHLVVIQVVLGFSGLVLAESVLSYLGVGVGTDTGSWGNMINLARYELARDPIIWWPLASAFVMMLGLVLPANLFGDCLRDALDPRLRK